MTSWGGEKPRTGSFWTLTVIDWVLMWGFLLGSCEGATYAPAHMNPAGPAVRLSSHLYIKPTSSFWLPVNYNMESPDFSSTHYWLLYLHEEPLSVYPLMFPPVQSSRSPMAFLPFTKHSPRLLLFPLACICISLPWIIWVENGSQLPAGLLNETEGHRWF